ncbi:MAG: TetR family transcriptional regulator C-terminal domain-containing protein [Deltaproteobacteria bacterium]|nr:TetR family transcriptional regulator C-terminal domain-containing protein [Deltaproteobacteria bacterium]
MGRPRKSEATRQRLIAAGIRQISAHGVSGTGLNALLEEAAAAAGSFYNFYPSKAAFVEAALDAYAASLLGLFDELFGSDSGRAPLQRLAAAHGRLISLVEEGDFAAGCLLGTVGAEACTTLPALRPVLQQAFGQWRTRLEALLAEGQSEGSVRNDLPAAQLAELFLAVWQGALIQMRVEVSSRPLVETLEVALQLLRSPDLAR